MPPLLRQAVAEPPVAAEQRDGYKRTSFRHWVDADADGCTARPRAEKFDILTGRRGDRARPGCRRPYAAQDA